MAGWLRPLPSLFSFRILEKNPNTNLQSSLSHLIVWVLFYTEKKGEKPREPTDIRKDLFLTLGALSCHPTNWPPALLQSWNQKLGPQAFSSRPATKEGRQLQPKCLGLRESSGTNQREQDPEELSLPQQLAPAARPCNAHGKYASWEGSAGSGSFDVLDNYFLHKHLMKISERVWCCQWRSFGLFWRIVNCDVSVV